jgi:hypothetical protein
MDESKIVDVLIDRPLAPAIIPNRRCAGSARFGRLEL